MIHRKKNRPALQRRDILTVTLVSFCLCFACLSFFIANLLRSPSFHPVLSGSVLYSIFYNCVFFRTRLFRAFC